MDEYIDKNGYYYSTRSFLEMAIIFFSIPLAEPFLIPR